MKPAQRLKLMHQMTASVNGNAAQVLDDVAAVATRPAPYVENVILPRYVPVAEVDEGQHRRKVGLLILHVLHK